jgi:hypothetical protein
MPKMRKYERIKPKKRKVKNSISKSNINKQNVKVNIMGTTPSLGGSISHMHIHYTVPFSGSNPYNFTDLNTSIKSLENVIKQTNNNNNKPNLNKTNYII